MKNKRVKKRLKTSVLFILLFLLMLLLGAVKTLNNKPLTLIYFITQFIILNRIYKRL